jgi:AcrR family transcriptional regulator
VLTTALELIDREGSEASSMRRIADELGVGAMTLYGYVRNREQLVEGVTALAFAELSHEPPLKASWEHKVRTDAANLYALCRRHPNLVPLILEQTYASPGLFRMRERMLGTLQLAGFDRETALWALGALTSYALGFGRTQSNAPIEFPEQLRALPPSEFPYLSAAADSYPTHLSDDAFAYGLNALLRGLRADLRAVRSKRKEHRTVSS